MIVVQSPRDQVLTFPPGVMDVREAGGAAAAAASYYVIDYNGTTTKINGGHGASLADLCLVNLTAEAWVKPTGWGESSGGGQVFSKYNSGYSAGWELTFRQSVTSFAAFVKTNVGYEGGNFAPTQSPDSAWRHVALTFTGASTKILSLFVNGVKSSTTVGVTGTPSADGATSDMIIGNLADGSRTFAGSIGWMRISNSIRYTGTFTPVARCSPPATDGNTVLLYKLTAGSGTTITDSSGNGNAGTLTSGTWTACS